MPRSRQNNRTSLGRCLIKQKNALTGNVSSRSQLHSLKNPSDGNEGILESITEQTNLAEFMTRVKMSEQNYEARNLDVKLLTVEAASGVLTPAEKEVIRLTQEKYHLELRIPRRPYWDENTTKEELHEAENEAFTNWRLQLNRLANVDNLTMTPYEKNSHVWQQLWRVVERSDVIVQIVDARNPLLFRCTDLERYVKEVDANKVNLILVNKSDHLSKEQREAWASYFRESNIYAVFFSALESSAEYGKQEPLGDILEQHSDEEEGDVTPSSHSDNYQERTQDDAIQQDQLQNLVSSLDINNTSNGNTALNNHINSTLHSVNSQLNADVITGDSKSSDEGSDSELDYESASSVPESLPYSKSSPSSVKASVANCNSSKAPLVTNSKLYNREELIELLSAVSPAPRLLQSYTTIGWVGYPNVGKSSTINCLMSEKRVTVSATPGKTKHFQTLHLSPELVLCDCPGLVFPGFVSTKQEMILWGILPIDRIKRDYHSSIFLICNELSPATLEAAYSIPLPGGSSRPPTPEELLTAYSVTRSFMSARGRADTSRAARAILKDFMNGRLLHCVAPPTVAQDLYHTYTMQPKCKNRVKLTPQQQLFMPETSADVDAHLDALLGLTTEDETRSKGSKPRKTRIKKPKGFVDIREGADGVEVTVTKPWRNRGRGVREGKKNPNTNDPYGQMLW